MPMLVAKQEKTLAIDGVYIHVSPLLSSPPSTHSFPPDYAFHQQGQSRLRQWQDLLIPHQEHRRLPTEHQEFKYLQVGPYG